ncbi:hypothetical protein Gogos_006948 [Gossypium gossypioides]|uniref:RNase H type-1 domain-containing protein n=1 Tax=Gossypium gossypioides TaxID=34282 RepID=A0A7J9C7A0_GOSGO|nr:hypothetical protein [Gossypium gossypioides]
MLINNLRNGLATVNNIVEVRMIHEWFYKSWEVKCRYILKDSNKVANCLAKEAEGRMNQLLFLMTHHRI